VRFQVVLLIAILIFAASVDASEESTLTLNDQEYYRLEIIAYQFNFTLYDLNLVDTLQDQGIDLQSAREQSRLTNTITQLDLGRSIELVVMSADAAHGLIIDELGVSLELDPPVANQTYGAEQVVISDLPSVDSTIRVYCNVYCGDGHSEMQFILEVGEGREFGGQQINPLRDWRVWVLFGMFAGGAGFVILLAVTEPPEFLKRYLDR
jgi:heme/copper-type cytochrome/quinol oxidase subunit 2